MDDALASFALLAATIATLVAIRKQRLVIQIATETLLIAAIAGFLYWHGTGPLPSNARFPVGLAGAWLRTLAVIWWLISARLAVNIALVVRGRDPRARNARLFSELIAALIYLAAILIILNSVLDLPIAGLLATSGVIAIVLGLALQNTLADVFAGIAVAIEKPFHVGDRVSLGENEGVIVEITWRSLRIQTDSEDLVTIPNSVVAKGQIINRSVPSGRRAATVEITVASGIPSERVIALMSQATLLATEVLPTPAPLVTLKRSGLNSATYVVTFFVADSPMLTPARSTLLRQIRRLLYHAGIVPERTVSPADLLASTALFEGLPTDTIEALASHLVVRNLDPDGILFKEGDTGTALYIVEAGVLALTRSASTSQTKTLRHIGPGDNIGELGLITGAARGVTVSALTRARVYELPGEALSALLASNKDLCPAMERSVQRGIALLDRDGAARVIQTEEHGPALLTRIRDFFASHYEALR